MEIRKLALAAALAYMLAMLCACAVAAPGGAPDATASTSANATASTTASTSANATASTSASTSASATASTSASTSASATASTSANATASTTANATASTSANATASAETDAASDATPFAAQDAASGAAASATSGSTVGAASGEAVISFEYAKQSGSASNQFAVWIEDMDGRLVKTLFATRYTANGGYKARPDSISLWVERSGLASMDKAAVDAISGATPKAGALSYAWDLSDENGDTIETGEYMFFVEGTLRWKNRVLYSGTITIGDGPSSAEAVAEFTYEGTDRQPALTDSSPENAMIGPVAAVFTPGPSA